jgi:DNA (cytosine-5)-methyltransferase 1
MTLTVGSLFSGIGGLDLGLDRAGMNVIWQSEIDPYACRVLSKHWPEVVNHGNIKEINWQEVERPDVICGGYPCQPFSTAGKRRGEEDPRHLWPWVRTAISELRPRYAILENVRGHLSMGGLSVIGELASIGYDAEWRIVSATSVGANHRRDRVIIVAYPQSQCGNGLTDNTRDSQQSKSTTQFGDSSRPQTMADTSGERCVDGRPKIDTTEGRLTTQPELVHSSSEMAHTDSIGLEGQRPEQQTTGSIRSSQIPNANLRKTSGGNRGVQSNRGAVFDWASDLRGEEGYAGWQWWTTEPNVGRVAHGVPNRVDRLRGLGNAVVPQVAEVIGRLVISHAQHN